MLKIKEKLLQNQSNVYIFVPNLIGYFRILCLFIFYQIFHSCPYTSVTIYLFNVFLDFMDGIAARKYNQCSKFGALFDSLTDLFATLSIPVYLAQYHQCWLIEILFWSIFIDLAGKWMESWLNSQNQQILEIKNKYLKFYYDNTYLVFDIIIVLNQMFYSFSILMIKVKKPGFFVFFAFYLSALGFFIKNVISGIRIYYNITQIIDLDKKKTEQR